MIYFYNKEIPEKISKEIQDIIDSFEGRHKKNIDKWLENSEVKKILSKREKS